MSNYHHLFALVEIINRQLIELDAILGTFQMVRPLLLINTFPVYEAVIKRVWKRGSNSTVRHASFPYKIKADFLGAKTNFIIHSLLKGIIKQSMLACRNLLSDLKLFPRTQRLAKEHSATQFKMVNLIKHKQLKWTLSWLKKSMRMGITAFLQNLQYQSHKCQWRYLPPHNRCSTQIPSLPLKMTVIIWPAIIKWRR